MKDQSRRSSECSPSIYASVLNTPSTFGSYVPPKRILGILQENHFVGQRDALRDVGDHTVQDAVFGVEIGLHAIPSAFFDVDTKVDIGKDVLGPRKKLPSMGLCGRDEARSRHDGRVGVTVEIGKANLHRPVQQYSLFQPDNRKGGNRGCSDPPQRPIDRRR